MYDVWGSVTGRLTTKPDSFPILTLNKGFRSLIAPNNDLFVELDANDKQLDFPILFSSGRDGWCVENLNHEKKFFF